MTYTYKISARLALLRGALMAVALVATACTDNPLSVSPPDGESSSAIAAGIQNGQVLVGAGNIARCDSKRDEATGKLLDHVSGTVFTTGDNVYASGSAPDFTNCYGSAWGRHTSRTRPAPGQKEYKTSGASGYFGYFGSAAGDAGRGYYSYALGDWQVIVLNSEIAMSAGSTQEQWLRQVLAANGQRCTIAYWNLPRFSSYSTYVRSAVKPLWDALYDAGADIVVNGHYRIYERFAPQTPDEQADARTGIRQFTVGTGGQGTDSFGTPRPNSEVRLKGVYGVLKLTLGTDAYAWEFLSTPNGKVLDSGSGSCNDAPGASSVATVDVTPSADTVTVGSSVQLSAVASDASGTILQNQTMTWVSRDTMLTKVTATGLVTGVAAGVVYAVASGGGQNDSSRITVVSPPPVAVASVTVSPASASVLVGATAQLTATVRDGAGTTLTGRTVTWATSAAAVATVSSAGLVTGVAAGTATITATSEGQRGTATITVSAPATSTCDATGSGVCRYVDAASGNDANPGTSSQPYRTLQQAANVVNPGDVVIVRNGVYTGGSTVLGISRSGTSTNGIVFRAETRWGAVIDGQNSSASGGVNISGSYIRVQGFEVRGTSRYGIEAYGGRDVQVAQNHIHAIGNVCSSSSGGIVGINAYVSNMVIERNLVHDVGRYAGGENGCSPTNTYWQNHDHGIYHGQGDNVVIRNNVFYDLTHGWAIQRYNGNGLITATLSIVNNTFVGANPYRDGQIIIATGTSNLLIANNLFYQPKTAGVYFDAGGLTGTMANNLTYGASLSTGSTSSIVITGNLVNQDPKFVNTGTRDFHLQAGSPAISAGMMLSGVLDDFDGLLRLAGVAPEIGAYRYQ